MNSVMPPQASTFANDVDLLYSFQIWASLISGVILLGGMFYFIWKYKRRTDTDKVAYITHNHALEFLWSFIPLVLFLAMFVWGAVVYYKQRNMPADGIEIHVTGRQWSWEFEYKNGLKSAELIVPIGKPVKLVMTSTDVLHSFFIPSFRQKQDVIPGRYSSLWFEATKKGVFQIYCAEFCGTAHSAMLSKLKVVDQKEFHDLMTGAGGEKSIADKGKDLYNIKGCVACHNTTDATKIGPGFKGLFGKKRDFADGSSVTADENYIRDSLLNPQAKIVKGFPPSMPTFQGSLEEEEIKSIIEFIKTLK